MTKCGFCGKNIEKGTGKLYVYKSGKFIHLCSRKCQKNLLKLKRKPVKLKWTSSFEKAK